MTPMTWLPFAFDLKAASNPVRYNTESRVSPLSPSVSQSREVWGKVLCTEAGGAIGICDIRRFGMLLCTEDDCLVELVERRHDAKLVAFTPASKSQRSKCEVVSGAEQSVETRWGGERQEREAKSAEICFGGESGRRGEGEWQGTQPATRALLELGGSGRGERLRLEIFYVRPPIGTLIGSDCAASACI